MIDKNELKRLATAANAVMGDVRVDVAITSESGPNQDEIDSVAAFLKLATPAAVLALIAENERFLKLLDRMVEQCVPLTELEGVPGWSRVVELVEVVEQRDQLKAENEALRKDAERYRGVRRVANRQGFTDEQFDQQTDTRTAKFDAAMGKEEQP